MQAGHARDEAQLTQVTRCWKVAIVQVCLSSTSISISCSAAAAAAVQSLLRIVPVLNATDRALVSLLGIALRMWSELLFAISCRLPDPMLLLLRVTIRRTANHCSSWT